MDKNHILNLFLITILFLLAINTMIIVQPFHIINTTGSNHNSQNLKSSNVKYTNATVISDGYNGVYWNDGSSFTGDIAVDDSGGIHVVWYDYTDGIWGTDSEIMYASYTDATGWSNITVISDGYMGIYWNDGVSKSPDITVDDSGGIHVVWEDWTNGIWGTDLEIMYASYSEVNGWSNATVISDGYMGIYWNDGRSDNPKIAIDNSDKIHVVWYDWTDGIWGGGWVDTEIMHTCYSEVNGWSNITVISDGYMGIYWNDAESTSPDITVDNSDKIHVVWYDSTGGIWGTDLEIMYASYTETTGWSNATVISDGFNGSYWNDGRSWEPDITVDDSGGIHVVWFDWTNGIWGIDPEIMYASYTETTGWSNATVISDGYGGIYWNNDASSVPDITVDDSGGIHVIWNDWTDGIWGTDREIMYASYTETTGWSNATVISDGYGGIYWNNDTSSVAKCTWSHDKLYVVWYDDTNGEWGTDLEIMFTSVSISEPTPSIGVPLGNFYLSIVIICILGLIIYINRKFSFNNVN